MAQWLSWLERRPVTAEVESSSLFWVVMWDLSSAGRASALQAEGHRFEPCRSHLTNSVISYADVAQLAEQLICNQQVIGSSPIIGFIQFNIELYYGQIPEWPKGTDCKSAANCFGGSNPPPPIRLSNIRHKKYRSVRFFLCRRGGTGRRTGLKILRDLYSRTGSIPVFGTIFLVDH